MRTDKERSSRNNGDKEDNENNDRFYFNSQGAINYEILRQHCVEVEQLFYIVLGLRIAIGYLYGPEKSKSGRKDHCLVILVLGAHAKKTCEEMLSRKDGR
jgi:hypothetical protein